MQRDKCGIYKIRCGPTRYVYVGSSLRIYGRWYVHRLQLRRGKHHNVRLQAAWNRYGEEAFRFLVIEECHSADLEAREQFYIDTLSPKFNILRDVSRGLVEFNKARFALITHCPKGHVYDEANTKIHQGKRVCRKCNAERVSGIYAAETPEQREARRIRANADHEKNRPARLVAMREYVLAHKAEKRAYDASRRAKTAARRREQRAAMTPEQREAKREQKRAWYAANRDRS